MTSSQLNARLLRSFTDGSKEDWLREVSGVVAQGPQAWSMLEDVVKVCPTDHLATISAGLLSSLEHRSDTQIELKRRIFMAVVDRLKERMTDSQANVILSALGLATDSLSPTILVRLIRDVTSEITDHKTDPNTGRWLDVLPKLLERVAAFEIINDGADRVRGPDFRRHTICSITAAHWAPETAVKLASVLIESDVNAEERDTVLSRLGTCMKEATIQDLPGIAHMMFTIQGSSSQGQKVLHLLAKTYRGHAARCKESQGDDADSINSAYCPPVSLKEVYESQGTVILHIYSLVEQGNPVGAEIVSLAKESHLFLASVLDPFILCVFVALARQGKYQQQILDSLRAAFVGHLKENDQLKDSAWLREVAPPAWNPGKVITDAVNVAVYAGCEPLMGGLMDLAFALVKVSGREDATWGFGAAEMATEILMKLIKRDSDAIREVLHTIRDLICCCKNPRLLAEIFSRLVKSSGRTLISKGLQELKLLCGTVGSLSFPVAQTMLYAMSGLLRYSAPLRDSLIMGLKKLLFSPSMNARMVSLSGLLILVEHHKIVGCTRGLALGTQMGLFSLSQVPLDGFARPSAMSESHRQAALTLVMDVLCTLRRCLTQQTEVKKLLFHGLSQAVKKNAELGTHTLRFLLPHFKRYVKVQVDQNNDSENDDEDGGSRSSGTQRRRQNFPPLDLNMCLSPVRDEGFKIDEPIGDLLLLVSECILSSNDEAENFTARTSSVVDDAKRIIGRVCEVYGEATVEMIMNEDADFSPFTNGGQFNVLQARLHLSVMEALMQSVWRDAGGAALPQDRAEEILLLFRLHSSVAEKLREKEKVAAKAKKASASANQGQEKKAILKLPPLQSTFSVHFIESCVSALFSDDDPAHQSGLSVLRNRTTFVIALLTSWQELLARQPDNQLLPFASVKQLGRVLLVHCDEIYASTEESDRVEVTLCLEALETAMKLVRDVYPHKFWTYMCFVAGTQEPRMSKHGVEMVENENVMNALRKHIEVIQKVVGNVLDDDEKVSGKAVVPALSLIVFLTRLSCEFDNDLAKEINEWMVGMFNKEGLSLEAAGMKAMMSAWGSLTLMAVTVPKSAKGLTHRIMALGGPLGANMDESFQADPDGFTMMNDKMWLPVAVTGLCSFLDRLSDFADSTVSRLKKVVPLAAKGDDFPFFSIDELAQLEPKVCSQMAIPCHLHGMLIRVKLGAGSVESMFKSIVKSVTAQTNLARYFMTKLNKMKGEASLPHRYPTKVVSSFCTVLAPKIPEFIISIEQGDGDAKAKKKSDPSVERARIMKQTKSYSDIIFAVDKYEQVLLQLSKKSGLNLLHGARLPTARDFRIDKKVLMKELGRGDGDGGSDDGTQAAPTQAPTRRRARRSEDQEGTDTSQATDVTGSEAPPADPAPAPAPAKRRRTLGGKRKQKLLNTPSSTTSGGR